MRRRAFLASAAAVGLAGCLGDDLAAGTPGTEAVAGTPETDADAGAVTRSASSRTTAHDAGGSNGADSSTATTEATVTRGATRQSTGTATTTATATASGPSTATGTPIHPSYEKTEVRMRTPGGEQLASVTAAIADTQELRYTGLSDTETLPPDRGMLFVYDEVQDLTYVMREMDFGIDIVYADDEGVITDIHHAPAPGPNEDGNDQRYPGRGQYVLEVNYEFTTEHGVETGDVLAFEL